MAKQIRFRPNSQRRKQKKGSQCTTKNCVAKELNDPSNDKRFS